MTHQEKEKELKMGETSASLLNWFAIGLSKKHEE